jgi:RNA polymerase-interacting CarD/CdnL/TRCF family regulator
METNPLHATFEVGTTVIYSTHGKCVIRGIEQRSINGSEVSFYKLEVQKPTLSRSVRPEASIWLPVNSEQARNLRTPMDTQTAEQVLSLLGDREYYFSLQEPWSEIFPRLEACIRDEGAVGLAKAYGYLHVLERKHHQLLPVEISRFQETVKKMLLRELTEALGQQMRQTDEQVEKLLRKKSTYDH